jgi:tRNA G18 (ribose-2'-O)-methylase SpoU
MHVDCYGNQTGSTTVNASGGTPGYSYLWSNSQTTQTATGLLADIYYVIVTDAQGCTALSQVTITQPPVLLVNAQVTHVSCNGGNDGAISTTTQGGTPGYSYLWTTGQTTYAISGLTAGNYRVTVTDSHACTMEMNLNVTQPDILTASASVVFHVSCYGMSDGVASVSVSGGTPDYTYLWSDSQTTQAATGLIADTYYVLVTDAHGCTALSQATVTQPPVLIVNAQVTPVTCNGGSDGAIFTTTQGGIPPYSYSWSNGATSSFISGLSAGLYNVTVTDSHACPVQLNINVNQPPPLSPISSVINHVSCYGMSDGAATVSVSGGTPDYTYLWSNSQTTQTINGLLEDTYYVMVTDAHGCTALSQATVTQPPVLMVNAQITPVSCNGGSNGAISTTAQGGTPPYAYSWSTGATTSSISGLTAGAYHVTVTDSHACTMQMNLNVNQPLPLSATALVINHVSCYGMSDGVTTVSVSGGTPDYTYLWSSSQSTQTATGLLADTYYVMVTDAHGCTALSQATVTQPPVLMVNAQITHVTCKGASDGAISTTAQGGTPSYSYSWSNGATTSSISDLTAGTYHVTVTDSHACTMQLNLNVTQPTTPCQTNIVQNKIIPANTYACYDALETLIVAGSGTYFIVETGGSVDLIAGQQILLKPGVTVQPGGHLHARITTNNQFCANPDNVNPGTGSGEESIMGITSVDPGIQVKIYPNPSPGSFIVELLGHQNPDQIDVSIYNMQGEKIVQKTMHQEYKQVFSIDGAPSGIYTVHVYTEGQSVYRRVLKIR